MSKVVNLIGQKFNKLTVVCFSHLDDRKQSYWECQCDCGNKKITRGTNLRSGLTKSCGCLVAEKNKKRRLPDNVCAGVNLIGKRFGHLLVIAFFGRDKNNNAKWICKCDCGNTKNIYGSTLKSGGAKSCGNCKNLSAFDANFNRLYSRYINSARNRGYSFSLSRKEFEYFISKDCYYCGQSPIQRIKTRNQEYSELLYNGIDRIDNTKGYEIGNCVTCCRMCNTSKGTSSQKEFLFWIKQVYEYNKLGVS